MVKSALADLGSFLKRNRTAALLAVLVVAAVLLYMNRTAAETALGVRDLASASGTTCAEATGTVNSSGAAVLGSLMCPPGL